MRKVCEGSKSETTVLPKLFDLVYALDLKVNETTKNSEDRHNIFIIMEYFESDLKKLTSLGNAS